MKLKHIFENQEPLSAAQQETLTQLSKHFMIRQPSGSTSTATTFDEQGRLRVEGNLFMAHPTAMLGRMPVQLESVNSIVARGLDTLEGLPKYCESFLEIPYFTGQDLTSATPVYLGDNLSGEIGQLYLSSCPNLKTLRGIENFKSVWGDSAITVKIEDCDNLAIDPYDYVKGTDRDIVFSYKIPRRVQLVKSIALTDDTQVSFRLLVDNNLNAIINKWRNKGPAAMIPLARELIAAGYERHVRPT